jgi:hypothetical protein
MVLDHLKTKYRETTVALGVESNGRILEVTVSEDKATWTVLLILPNGCVGVVASGEYWHAIKQGVDG